MHPLPEAFGRAGTRPGLREYDDGAGSEFTSPGDVVSVMAKKNEHGFTLEQMALLEELGLGIKDPVVHSAAVHHLTQMVVDLRRANALLSAKRPTSV